MARCCVRGCNKRSPADVKFYRFPGRAWQSHIMAKWIEFVSRIRNDGVPWYPNKDSRVCSSHFIGNAKSHNPASPSFIPTIAPGQTSQLIVAGHGLDSLHRPATKAEFGLLVDCLRDAELRRENSDGQSTVCEPDIEGMLLSAEFEEEFVGPTTESSANCSTPKNSVAKNRVLSVSSNEMTSKIDDVTASDFADKRVTSEWPLQCIVKEEPETSNESSANCTPKNSVAKNRVPSVSSNEMTSKIDDVTALDFADTRVTSEWPLQCIVKEEPETYDADDRLTVQFSVEESDTSHLKLVPKQEVANELDLDAPTFSRIIV